MYVNGRIPLNSMKAQKSWRESKCEVSPANDRKQMQGKNAFHLSIAVFKALIHSTNNQVNIAHKGNWPRGNDEDSITKPFDT